MSKKKNTVLWSDFYQNHGHCLRQVSLKPSMFSDHGYEMTRKNNDGTYVTIIFDRSFVRKKLKALFYYLKDFDDQVILGHVKKALDDLNSEGFDRDF